MTVLEKLQQWLGLRAEDRQSRGRTFEHRQVSPLAEYDLGFYGRYEYRDDVGELHRVERRFDVVLEDDHRENGRPTATVTEETYVGDADTPESEDVAEIIVDIDPELEDNRLRTAIEQYLSSWHRDRDPRSDDGETTSTP